MKYISVEQRNNRTLITKAMKIDAGAVEYASQELKDEIEAKLQGE